MVINGFSVLKSSLGCRELFPENRQTIEKRAASCFRTFFHLFLFPGSNKKNPENYKLCQSFTLHFMDEQCLPFVGTNYVVIYVWMNVASIRQQKSYAQQLKQKEKKKTFSFSRRLSRKLFSLLVGFFSGACKEYDEWALKKEMEWK